MSNYHTNALEEANIFTIMGSVYAEVARYDSAINAGQSEQASRAVSRALEIITFTQKLKQINLAQKQEIKKFSQVFLEKVKQSKKSDLDNYLMPFAVSARLRQF